MKHARQLRDQAATVGRRIYGLIRRAPAPSPDQSDEGAVVAAKQTVPELRTLSPEYDEAEHEVYVEILSAQLRKSGDGAPHNVALTGHYGSGKSSVLSEVQKRLASGDDKQLVINLSLPSLNIGDGRLPAERTSLDKTNLIQKEIVKQLLYRQAPAKTPASRYRRLDAFDARRARWRAGWFALFVTGVAFLWRLPDRVRDAAPAKFWDWVDRTIWGDLSTPIQWLSLVVFGGLIYLGAVRTQRLLQRMRVTEFAAGPTSTTKVTLSEGSTSFFDEYLDEIVYYFQSAETQTVIFEDLDRFEDPHIFETLRELNLLLNNAEQIKKKPVRFVYAIRDSVFEQLEEPSSSPNDTPQRDAADDLDTESDVLSVQDRLRAEADERRLKSTNRTKFFDLVVPIVPFVSHKTSRELILSLLEEVPKTQRPHADIVGLVSPHLTDMRLIKNICNEYDIFWPRILSDDGLTQLDADRLFASIVYKNLYLGDYEDIRNGTSRLDVLYAAYRQWIERQADSARENEQRVRRRLSQLNSTAARADSLGQRLQEVLIALTPPAAASDKTRIAFDGKVRGWEYLRSESFWRALIEDESSLQVTYWDQREMYQRDQADHSFATIQTLVNESLNPQSWAEQDRAALTSEVEKYGAQQSRWAHASLSDALEAGDLPFTHHGHDTTLTAVAAELFVGADIVLDLLREDFIDENFTLYLTKFPGGGSASAMNFSMKAVQRNRSDFIFHFGESDAVDTEAIDRLVASDGRRLLGGRSVYNKEIFDHLLATDPQKLADPIARLVANVDGENLDFIAKFIASGTQRVAFVRELAARWTGVFDYIVGDDQAVDLDLLNAAFEGASSGVGYTLEEARRDTLREALTDLPVFTSRQGASRAVAIAETVQKLGCAVPSIGAIEEPLRAEVVQRNLYDITLDNLRSITGEESVALDALQSASASTYKYVLRHLTMYLGLLRPSDSEPLATVESVTSFAPILNDLEGAEAGDIEAVASLASPECVITDLSGLEPGLWPAVVKAKRLHPTTVNVAAYLDQYGLDEALADQLSASQSIQVVGGDEDVAELARNVLNTPSISVDVRLALVRSLSLPADSITAPSLDGDGRAALPGLVAAGLVPDTADAYLSLAEDEEPIKEALINVSSAFPEYMLTTAFTPNDLRLMAAQPVPESVKDALLSNYATFEPTLREHGARYLAQWAAAKGRRSTGDVIASLATKAGHRAARAIMQLLGEQASDLDLSIMYSALEGLGGQYLKLTVPGREQPKIPMGPGVREVLTRLQLDGSVSKIKDDFKRNQYKVTRRYR